MNAWMLGLLIAYGVIVAVWVIRLVVVIRATRKLLFLSPRDLSRRADCERPFVSILVPVGNEEATIDECLASLRGQDYLHFEVIVIDDRSVDATAKIVRDHARSDPRVRLKTVAWLPPGWTGKAHALHQGARQARGEWLLFVDADTRHHPRTLSVTLNHALEQRLDLLSLLPKLEGRSFWEQAVQPLAGVVLMIFFRLQRVNADACSDVAFANGQYILIRRKVYEVVDGHAAVRRHFVEDIELGRRVKRAGHRLRVGLAPELTSTRMYASLSEIVSGWSRILYGAVEQRSGPLLLVMLAIGLFSLTAFAVSGLAAAMVLADRPGAWTVLGMNLLHHLLIAAVMGKLYSLSHSRKWALLFYLPACLVVLTSLARAVRLCFTHRVTWRQTEYGPELRKAA